MSRALTEAEMRGIIRAYPEPFLMLSRFDPHGDTAAQMGDVIAAAPEAVGEMVMLGLELASLDEVRALGFFGCCTAATSIATLTQRAHEPEILLQIFTSELARIVSSLKPRAHLTVVKGGR